LDIEAPPARSFEQALSAQGRAVEPQLLRRVRRPVVVLVPAGVYPVFVRDARITEQPAERRRHLDEGVLLTDIDPVAQRARPGRSVPQRQMRRQDYR
jgi:hypothetical protein